MHLKSIGSIGAWLFALAATGICGKTWAAGSAEQMYQSFCASCHGPDMSGGLAPPLANGQWKYGKTDEEIAQVIKKGIPKVGMPAWEKSLSDADIRALIILIRERVAQGAEKKAAKPQTSTITAAGYSFALEKIAEAPGELWSMDFLADGRIISTQKDGKLWVFDKGQRTEIKGIPQVWSKSQGGLLEVQQHTSGWIYLTFSHPDKKGAMTKVVRGKIDGDRWVDEQTIFAADSKFYTDSGVHFGSRLVFQDDYVFFSIGERGQQELAQDLSYPNGKIHRLHLDGRIPADNPFVKDAKALPSIWSYGHRNPQGLALQPGTGLLWDAEHGPRGGDEINLIIKGANYGWPVITYGMNYSGTPITNLTHKEGMEQPKHYWVPSIAVSEIDFYTGERFPNWRGHLLVGSLAKEQLRLVRVDGDKVVGDELLFQGRGRIRDVADGPDGYPYVVIAGDIFRLVPTSK